MEFLLIIILILLVFILIKSNSNYKATNKDIDGIPHNINQLRKEISAFQKSKDKTVVEVNPISETLNPLQPKPIIVESNTLRAHEVLKPTPIPSIKTLPVLEPLKPKDLIITKKSWYQIFKENVSRFRKIYW